MISDVGIAFGEKFLIKQLMYYSAMRSCLLSSTAYGERDI